MYLFISVVKMRELIVFALLVLVSADAPKGKMVLTAKFVPDEEPFDVKLWRLLSGGMLLFGISMVMLVMGICGLAAIATLFQYLASWIQKLIHWWNGTTPRKQRRRSHSV
jgi:hypothetical protein